MDPDPEYKIRIFFGRVDRPKDKARAKKLHGYLSMVVKDFEMISPVPKFAMIEDQYGQIQVKMNERMMMYLLYRFTDFEEDEVLATVGDGPPDWFMHALGGTSDSYRHH